MWERDDWGAGIPTVLQDALKLIYLDTDSTTTSTAIKTNNNTRLFREKNKGWTHLRDTAHIDWKKLPLPQLRSCLINDGEFDTKI